MERIHTGPQVVDMEVDMAVLDMAEEEEEEEALCIVRAGTLVAVVAVVVGINLSRLSKGADIVLVETISLRAMPVLSVPVLFVLSNPKKDSLAADNLITICPLVVISAAMTESD